MIRELEDSIRQTVRELLEASQERPDLEPRAPRFAGGLGREGTRALDTFVREGGTLVTLNRSSLYAIDQLHLPVRNVVADLERTEFFLGGSILQMIVDPSHPVMTGMPRRSRVFVSRSPVFSVTESFSGAVLSHYPAHGSPLLSGYLLGEKHLRGYASALDVAHGEGRVLGGPEPDR